MNTFLHAAREPLAVSLPLEGRIRCFDLAHAIARALHTPCCKVDEIRRSDRASATSERSQLTHGPFEYRQAPYAADWDPSFQLTSPVEERRLDEVVKRMTDFQRRVEEKRLMVFTGANDSSLVASGHVYMTRDAAMTYLQSCGLSVEGQRRVAKHAKGEPARNIDFESGIGHEQADASNLHSKSLAGARKSFSRVPSSSSERGSSLSTVQRSRAPRTAHMTDQLVTPDLTAAAVIRFSELRARTGLGRTSLFNRMSPNHKDFDPSFPQRIAIGNRAVGFLESEITAWILARQVKA